MPFQSSTTENKTTAGYFHVREIISLQCFGWFAAEKHVDGSFLFTPCNIYNRLVNMCSQDLLLDCHVNVLCVTFFGRSTRGAG